MKINNEILRVVMKLARNQPVTEEERQRVISWGRPAEERRFNPPVANADRAEERR
jgi:hypothetical protein